MIKLSTTTSTTSTTSVRAVPTVCAISVFSKTSTPSPKYFDNWFNGNKTNFGGKASIQPSFDNKTMIDNTNNKYRMNMPM